MEPIKIFRYIQSRRPFVKTFKHFPAYLLFLINTQLLAAEEFSKINIALFDSPHMQSIEKPGKLNYQYKKTKLNGQNKEDKVTVHITNISDTGMTDQIYDFFSGVNKQAYRGRRSQSGNAVFMLFLEWDVHEMERQTGGSWRHFQRRIRWAMAAGAEQKEVLIDYQGSEVKGTQYLIQPYANDDKDSRYGPYANKYYSFTLSDKIPGTIYEVRTLVPKTKIWKEGDEVTSDERIRFTGFTPSPLN